jgi:hypothetical protein
MGLLNQIYHKREFRLVLEKFMFLPATEATCRGIKESVKSFFYSKDRSLKLGSLNFDVVFDRENQSIKIMPLDIFTIEYLKPYIGELFADNTLQ